MMAVPDFFQQVPTIKLHDGLSEFLGAVDDGYMEYSYADAVRLAGHSCPTVAGAYLMARAGLRELYPDSVPERGNIEVTMSAENGDGTTGVIAQVFTLLTGAAAENGFHGIGGRFGRQGLLKYGSGDNSCIASFRRLDNGKRVKLALDLSTVPPDPAMSMLFSRAMSPHAEPEDRKSFAAVWQDRVRRVLLDHADDTNVVLTEVS